MDLINFFFNVAKTHFFHVFGVFGKLFRHIANGGGRTFLDASSRVGDEKF